jgi:hypothetical protein
MPSNRAFNVDLGQLGFAVVLLVFFISSLSPLQSRLKRFSENFADSVYRYFYVCAKTSIPEASGGAASSGGSQP